MQKYKSKTHKTMTLSIAHVQIVILKQIAFILMKKFDATNVMDIISSVKENTTHSLDAVNF